MVSREQTRSLLVQYISSSSSQKESTLHSLSELLDLSREDTHTLSRTELRESSDAAYIAPVKSFSQLFVEFLMQESNPQQSRNITHNPVKKEPFIEPVYTVRDRDERPSLSVVSLVPTNLPLQQL